MSLCGLSPLSSPPEAELAAIRRSNERGLPYGDPSWVKRLAKRLDLDLTIRPRDRPRKTTGTAAKDVK